MRLSDELVRPTQGFTAPLPEEGKRRRKPRRLVWTTAGPTEQK